MEWPRALRTPDDRLATAGQLDAEITGKVDRAMATLEPGKRGQRDELLLRTIRTLLYVDRALATIKTRDLSAWTIPLLSWMTLFHHDWKSESERRELTAKAIADDGALWWSRRNVMDVAPFRDAPVLSWTDFLTSLPTFGPVIVRWNVALGPYAKAGPIRGRAIEVWAMSCKQGDFGFISAPKGVWPFTLRTRLHAEPRNAHGAAAGELPHQALDLLLCPGLDEALDTNLNTQASYFRDLDSRELQSPLAPSRPDRTVTVPIHLIPRGSDPMTIALLVAVALIRSDLPTTHEHRQLERTTDRFLLQASTTWDLPSIEPNQLPKLRDRLLRNFTSPPRNAKSLRKYVALTLRDFTALT